MSSVTIRGFFRCIIEGPCRKRSDGYRRKAPVYIGFSHNGAPIYATVRPRLCAQYFAGHIRYSLALACWWTVHESYTLSLFQCAHMDLQSVGCSFDFLYGPVHRDVVATISGHFRADCFLCCRCRSHPHWSLLHQARIGHNIQSEGE